MGSLSNTSSSTPLSPLQYPPARRDESVVDNYHGVLIPDPYRWLEDPEAEETKQFVEKQIELTDSVLAKCEVKNRLKDKLTKVFDYPRYYPPFKRGDKYFYFHNTGLQAQNVLFVHNDLEGEAEVLLDPNTLSEDGTIALDSYLISTSKDGKYMAYGLSNSGSDWVTIKVMSIEDKQVLDDTLMWVKFGEISWTHNVD